VLTDWAIWLDEVINQLSSLAPDGTLYSFSYSVRGLLAILLVSLICGAVGSLVVGNRMAFFSDALAHCAFAGVGLGLLSALFLEMGKQEDFVGWVTLIMVVFGAVVGLLIALVRQKTGLANDTVIGVFFAGAMGLGALILQPLSRISYLNPENFLFGNPITVQSGELILIFLLAVATAVALVWMYNALVFASFNPSLARSRRLPVQGYKYLFIVLLAVTVNLCLKIVGALLINALLIVPAATAANVSRNMRQLFWTTIGLCLLVGAGGQWLSWEIKLPAPRGIGTPIHPGIGGTIVFLSVVLFFASMVLGPRFRGRQATA
jgi:zinc transport system permease protein